MRHRMWVCLLTALALVLLVIYLTYFRRYILQPLDTIADSCVRRAKRDISILTARMRALTTSTPSLTP